MYYTGKFITDFGLKNVSFAMSEMSYYCLFDSVKELDKCNIRWKAAGGSLNELAVDQTIDLGHFRQVSKPN